jgi:hypothetical protein
MRTHSKTVTFTRPFVLTGVEGVQPAGSYAVETEEEQLPVLLSSAFKRTTTWIFLPADSVATGTTQCVAIDPAELDAALRYDVAVSNHQVAEPHAT